MNCYNVKESFCRSLSSCVTTIACACREAPTKASCRPNPPRPWHQKTCLIFNSIDVWPLRRCRSSTGSHSHPSLAFESSSLCRLNHDSSWPPARCGFATATKSPRRNVRAAAGKTSSPGKNKSSKNIEVIEADEDDDDEEEEVEDGLMEEDFEEDFKEDGDIEDVLDDSMLEEDDFDEIEEEEGDVDVALGDGEDGGGVNISTADWGDKALSIAKEVLEEFGVNFSLYAFKVSPDGHVYVRLDKLSDRYGSPSMAEIESFSTIYNKKLELAGQSGLIPDNLSLEVSSPGAERVVLVPDQLLRFKDLPMFVRYLEETDSENTTAEKDGVLELQHFDSEAGITVWKIANVRVNRDLAGKGRGLNRKQRDWRLQLPLSSLRFVRLYMDI